MAMMNRKEMMEGKMSNETKINIPITMSDDFHKTIRWLVNNYEKEIAGWIVGKIDKDGVYMEELLIPEQEVGGSHVDMTAGNIVKMRNEYGAAKCKRIIGEWHSHNSMSAYWSYVDEDLIKQLMNQRTACIFIVSSVKDGHRIRMDFKEPFQMTVDEMPYRVDIDDKFKNKLEKEIEKKVTEKKYTGYSGGCEYPGYWNDGNKPFISGYSGNRGNEQTTLVKEKEDYEKQVKQITSSMIKFDKTTNDVMIDNIYWYQGEELCNEFEALEPVFYDKGNDMYASVSFHFNTKEKAVEFMKDVSEFLRVMVEEQINVGVYGEEGYGY